MKVIIQFCLTALIAVGLAQAQPGSPPVETDAGAFAHQLTLKDGVSETRYRQLVSPVSLSIPLVSGSLNVESGFMYLDVEDTTARRDISGPLDTQISAEWNLGKALLTGYANVPTGMDSLDATEAALTRDITRNDLNFPIKSFGQGLDFGGALTIAHQIGHWAVSVGGGYLVRGPYSPFVDVSDYDPGDEVTVTGGATYTTGGWTFGGDVSGKMIRVDRVNGTIQFRNGKQFTAGAAVTYESPLLRLDASIIDIVRLKDLARDDSSGALLYEGKDSNGNDLRARGRLDFRPIRGFTVFAEAEYKGITENAYNPGEMLYQGAARLWAYGGGITVKIGRKEALTARVTRGEGWINDRSQDVETLNARISVRLFF